MSFLDKIFGSSEDESQTSRIGWKPLIDLKQLDEIVELSNEKAVLIFKHSTRCSISRYALKQFEKEFDLEEKITPYFLDLLNYRDISNEIANRFAVVHQSPQIIVVKDEKAIYNTSHDSIDAKELANFI
jgi:bacillithiol system protein YtxJ